MTKAVAVVNERTDGSHLGPWEEKKIIKNERTFPYGFLLLVSLARKYVTVFSVKRQQCRAVCIVRLSKL